MQRECESCGRSYTARRDSSRFCGGTCGKRSQRARAAGIPLRTATSDDREAAPSGLERAVARELEAAGRLQSVAGQVALELAYRVASPHETGAAVAALARELSASMTKTLAGVDRDADPLDEIRARRDLKRSAGRL